jgi:hypothetical protein
MSERCPRCGGHYSDFETIELSNPHPDAFKITVRVGKTYRQLGISGKGKWIVYTCYFHQHSGQTVVWAELGERY